jgi:glycosyltransferase involved in cell wall biosynthesis
VLVLTSHHPSRREPAKAVFGYYTYQALATRADLRFVAPRPFWTRLAHPRELARTPRERWGPFEVEYPSFVGVPGASSTHALGLFASVVGRIGAIRRAFPFDAILAAWAYPDGAVAAALGALFGVPVVTTVLGSDVNELPRHRLVAPQLRAGLRRASRVVAVSAALGREVVRLGVDPGRVVVVHNGVDGDRFRPRDRAAARAALGLDPSRALVGYVGNLVPEKGPDVLVDAAALLRDRGAPVDVAMIGDGASRRAIEARIARHALRDRVRLLGRRLHDELPTWLAAIDALVLPSRREGCPNVVLEALASGRPVVASAVGGVPELLDADNGALVPAGDAAALADAVARAVARPWDPAALRATVPSLSWERVADAYERLIAEVLAEGSA